jgi:hypothetical protein
MWAAILSGLGGAVVGAVVVFLTRHSDSRARELGRIDANISMLQNDVNNIGRKVAGIESIVSYYLDKEERGRR